MKTILKKIYRKLVWFKVNSEDRKLISQLRNKNLTYLSNHKLAIITQVCRSIESKQVQGVFVEAGCALGGSTILISNIKNPTRQFYVYDVFDLIPPPSKEDGEDVQARYDTIRQGQAQGLGKDIYYGYQENLYETVRNNLKSFGLEEEQNKIFLIKGILQKTMQITQPVAFAHIDVDWYEPVKTCLHRIVPNLAIGGSIILDDYKDWSGCRKATDEYFNNNYENFKITHSTESMTITRVKK